MSRESYLYGQRGNYNYIKNRHSSTTTNHNNRPNKNQYPGTSARKIITNYYRIS